MEAGEVWETAAAELEDSEEAAARPPCARRQAAAATVRILDGKRLVVLKDVVIIKNCGVQRMSSQDPVRTVLKTDVPAS